MTGTKKLLKDHGLPDCGVLVCSAAYILGLGLAAAFCARLGEDARDAINTYVSGLRQSGYPFLRVLWLSLRALFPAVLLGFTYFGIFVLPFAAVFGGFVGGFSVFALFTGAYYVSGLCWLFVFARGLVLTLMCILAFKTSARLFTARSFGGSAEEGLRGFALSALFAAVLLVLLAAAECIQAH